MLSLEVPGMWRMERNVPPKRAVMAVDFWLEEIRTVLVFCFLPTSSQSSELFPLAPLEDDEEVDRRVDDCFRLIKERISS